MSGSYLVVSHITDDHVPGTVSREAQQVYDDATAPAIPRSYAEVAQFFDGLDLIEPGVADVSAWRGESLLPARTIVYGGVGRKP